MGTSAIEMRPLAGVSGTCVRFLPAQDLSRGCEGVPRVGIPGSDRQECLSHHPCAPASQCPSTTQGRLTPTRYFWHTYTVRAVRFVPIG